MTENEARKVINGERWIFAKTYAAFAPHEYVMRSKCNAPAEKYDEVPRGGVHTEV